MLDIRLIRERPDVVLKDLERRGDREKQIWFKDLIKKDKEYRDLLFKAQKLRHEKNTISIEISRMKKEGKDVSFNVKEMRKVSEEIKASEEKTEKLKERIQFYLLRLPNILHESVPAGKDESENVEIRKWGRIRDFTFKPKNHLELALHLGLIDADRAAKVAGHGFFYLKNELALLDMAIQMYAIEFLMKKGYTLIEPPLMLQRKPYEGVIEMEAFRDVLYKIEGEDLHLIATSEHPMAAMYMNEVIDKKDLPIKLVGISQCFRKEVGAHGKYTKGLFRMHQFSKVEQFVFCHPSESWHFHEELQHNSEKLYQGLEIPYRVVSVCTGDIGIIAAKKYDIEVWMADGKYREAGSNSNCTDYQARRLNIKYREGEGKAPEGFVHTLNNTALATSRVMLAILENYQQKDGSVVVPTALRQYMGGIKKIG